MRIYSALLILPMLCAVAGAQVYYPADNAFHILDMKGDAEVQEVEDLNVPLADSTRALDIKGEHVLGLVADAAPMAQGTLLVLYREMAPIDADADGILLFNADYPIDISEAHNIKQISRQTWLEVDNDSGLHLRGVDAKGEEAPLSGTDSSKLVSDSWPETGWLWQKVSFGDGFIRGKCWEAHQNEPEGWDMEMPVAVEGGRFGFRVGSGHIRLAWYGALASDAPLREAPALFLYPPKQAIADTGVVPLWLYTNLAAAGEHELSLSLHHAGERFAGITRTLSFPAGPARTDFTASSHPSVREEYTVRLRPNVPRGDWHVQAALGNETDTAAIHVIDTEAVDASFTAVEQAVDAIDALFPDSASMPGEIQVVLGAARAHAAFGRELLAEGRVDEATRTLNYGINGLNELKGPKGAIRPEIGPLLTGVPASSPHPEQGKGGEGTHVVYDPAWRVRFGAPLLEAQAMVMGHTYTVKVPVTLLGAAPQRDLVFHAELRSPYGHRTPAQASVTPDPPTSAWEGNTEQWIDFSLDIVADDAKPLTPEPLVLDEYHDLVLRATDPASGAPVLLANEVGRHQDAVGTGYGAARIYVSSTPVELRGFAPQDGPVAAPRRDVVTVQTLEGAPEGLRVLFSATAPNGEAVFEALQDVNTETLDASECAFTWTPDTAGALELSVAVLQGNTTVTEARRTVTVAPPVPVRVGKRKESVRGDGTACVTRLPVAVEGDADAAVAVYAGKRLVGEGAPGILDCEPWFGYYDVVVRGADWRYMERIVATTVTTEGMDLVVNGEPFLVKGVNVHGMDPRSPERTRIMMRILKDRNFNLLRGDYPAPWQMDLAYEMNLAYTVLAPFSCASTNEVFQRQDGPPLVTAREISRAMVDRYAEYPGVLLWNSCNEITEELDSFLISLYPVYVHLDPYRRPVHYANLYAQDNVRGQDLVGMNYYYGVGERAEDRHPIILRGIERAREQGLPVFYNEFNSWYGAIPGTGADALRDLFEWGVDQGMTGGVYYFRFNSDRHPGIFNGDYNTHKVIDDALHAAFDDARVSLVEMEGRQYVRIHNPRKFTLRQVRIVFEDQPEQPLADLPPGATVDVPLPPEITGLEVQGAVHYVTHYGFTGTAPFRLFASR